MNYTCANAYYFYAISEIGGIESHFYYLARKYKEKDIVIFYTIGDNKQVKRLKEYVRCFKVDGKTRIKCDKLFCCFNLDILDRVEAKEINVVLHGDYGNMVERRQLKRENLPINERIDNYYGVSELVCESWYKVTGIRAENLYEPIVLDEVDKPLMLVSATRLTTEKGFERMVKFARILDESGLNYLWTIYTNDRTKQIDSPNVQFQKPRLDIADKLGAYDYFVQLSDNEGFCLSVCEAWLRGVKVISTPLPVLKELGANKENNIEISFEVDNVDIEKIKKMAAKKFKYELPQDKWLEVLVDKPSVKDKLIKVYATDVWEKEAITDIESDKIPYPGKEMYLTEDRINYLIERRKNKKPVIVFEKENNND